jgi:hypothetical protein
MSVFKIAIGVVIGFVMLHFVIGAINDWSDEDSIGVKFNLFFLVLIAILTYVFLG